MGGADKPLLTLRGRPLVAHVVDRLQPQVSATVLIANRSLEQYAALRVPVHRDAIAGVGPLGGLLTALDVAGTPLVFCCPGDAPLMARDLVSRLTAALTPDIDAVYPHDGARGQPLFLLVRPIIRPVLERYLADGQRAVHGFLSTLRTTIIDAADIAGSFRNINTPEELDELERGAG